jgi:hypothetical protein
VEVSPVVDLIAVLRVGSFLFFLPSEEQPGSRVGRPVVEIQQVPVWIVRIFSRSRKGGGKRICEFFFFGFARSTAKPGISEGVLSEGS